MWDRPLVFKQIGDDAVIEIAHAIAGLDMPATVWNSRLEEENVKRLQSGGSSSWYGGPAKVVLKRLMEGWEEGAKEVRSMLTLLEIPIVPRRKRTRFGMDGEVDIQRFLFNEQEPFRQHARIIAPVVRLTVDVGSNGGTSGHTLKWRGATALAIADTLTNAGFSVEIVCMEKASGMWYQKHDGRGAEGGPQGFTYTIAKLKDAQAPLNLAVIAGAICTAGIFRITMWRSWYRAPWKLTEWHGRWVPMSENMMGDIHVDHTVTDQVSSQKFLAELPTCRKADLKAFLLKGGR